MVELKFRSGVMLIHLTQWDCPYNMHTYLIDRVSRSSGVRLGMRVISIAMGAVTGRAG